MSLKNIFLLVLFFLSINENAMIQENLNYTYYDMSGNRYVLNNDMLEYFPLTAKESSSGFYDGGVYKKKKLNKRQRNELLNVFNKAIEAKEEHCISNELKGNCSIIKYNGKSEIANYCLKIDALSNKLLVAQLKRILNIKN